MKVLVLAMMYPDTLACGYRAKLFRLLQGYHRHGHTLDLLCFAKDSAAGVRRGLVEPLCRKVAVFDKVTLPPWSSPLRWLTLAQEPDFESRKYRSAPFRSCLEQWLREDPPAAIHYDGYTMAQFRDCSASFPGVVFSHDCPTLALERERTTGVLRRLYYGLHLRKVRRVEARYDRFQAAFFVAEPDARRAGELSPRAHVVWAPNGVDADYFAPDGAPAVPESVAFSGSMGFPPNVEAVLWFADKVWPRLTVAHPRARFIVAGSDPAPAIQALVQRDGRIQVTGLVPDLRPCLNRAAVVVVPMQSGSGIKNKVLEAMALGRPVVANALALEGTPEVRDGVQGLRAETPEEFAQGVARLWGDPELAHRLGGEARRLVVESYSWGRVQDFCEGLLREAVGRGVQP